VCRSGVRVDGPALVTIGIPAYDRPLALERAIRSALAQDHRAIEVLVSDDASPDAAVTRTVLALAAEDPRVRFVRQPRNLGHAGNYQWLLDAARGEYFMWLSDDDWIDPQYVTRCRAVLESDPATKLVCGVARYYREGAHVTDERPTELRSRRPGLRVMCYFAQVTANGPLFGVARRTDIRAVGFPPVLGGDWLLVGALAARGCVRSLGDVHIHRSAAGLGSDAPRLARSFGYQGFRARHHHLFVAGGIWRAIVSGPPLFPDTSTIGRLLVANASAASIVIRFTLADIVRSAVRAGRRHASTAASRTCCAGGT
jgi:glycosyltransferase involved in cell wall biosynthesis